VTTIITQSLTWPVVRLGNLESRRDLTYVADTVDGFLRVAEVPDMNGQTFKLGSGSEVRIRELAEMIISIVGRPVEVAVDSARVRPEKSEVQRLLSYNSLACQRLGWEPHTSRRPLILGEA